MPNPSHPRPRRLASLAVTGTLAAAVALGGTAVAHAIGIDVSQWQHNPSVKWDRTRAQGVSFAFIKATEGSFYTNPHYAADLRAARRVGIYRGAYHFARPSKGSAARQARYFVARAGRHQGVGDLPPVLDLEDPGTLGVAGLRTWTRSWLETVERLTGRTPIIYTSPSFWDIYLGDSRAFRSYPLWVAHYETSRPDVPGGWSDWTFWQKTSTGRVGGINGAVDINRFNGTRAELAALAQASSVEDVLAISRRGVTTREQGDGTAPAADPKAATRVSLHLSTESVFRGQRVRFVGALKDTHGEGLPGHLLTLEQRAAGTSTWTRVASPTTSGAGRYVVSFTAGQPAAFRLRYRGDAEYAAAASPVRDLAARAKTPTRATLGAQRSTAPGRAVTLSGRLRTADGSPLPATTVSLYRLVDGATEWGLVTRTNTVAPTGRYQFLVRPSGIETYRAVFDGGVAHGRAESNLATVAG